MDEKKVILKLIQDQAYQTNDVLSSYILLHNRIIKNTSTLKSLFKKIDFEEPYNESKDLLTVCKKKQDELYTLRDTIFKKLNREEKAFISQLITVAENISKAAELLVKRQRLHYLKSKGDRTGWKDFSELQKKYKDAMQQCMKEKDRLNQLAQILF